jgi:hypothetical protein
MRSFCKHFGRIFAPLVLLLGLVALPSISNAVITAAIPDTTAKRDSTIDIPIRLTGVNPADDIISAEINLTFDSGILSAGTPSAGGIASGWSVSSYSSSGQIKIAMAGADSLTGNGVLLTIPFTVSGSATPGDNCTIHFAKCQFNEGSVSSTIDDGVFTVWAEYSISGSVTYYGGSNPAVSDVIMTLSGQESGADTTNAGNYSFSGLWSGYNYTVTPSKTNTSNSSAVTAMDASEVLQHIVGTDTLNTNQQTAGEVSDNGSLSAYDAALILRYAVGKITHFDAGDWTFTPGSTNYTPLNSNQTSQNYTAILYGDVTGNWSGSKGFKFSSSTGTGSNRKLNVDAIVNREIITDEVAELIVTNVIGSPGGKITVPIKARNINDVIATGMILKYDSDVLTATEVSATSLTADYLIEYRITAGEIKIALAGIEPLKSSGTLIVISFDVNESPRAVYSPLKLENVELNEGRITCEVRPGSFSTARGIQAVTSLPKEFALSGNYPNPFAHTTTIRYQLPMESEVSLVVYNVTGQVIRSLVKDKQEAGYYNVKWDGKDEFGRAITDGVYFYKMQISTEANNYTSVNKMILLR